MIHYKNKENAQLTEIVEKQEKKKAEYQSRISELEQQNASLQEEKKLREVQISLLKAEVQNNDVVVAHFTNQDASHLVQELENEKDKNRQLQSKLAKSKEESASMERKLESKNQEIALYKVGKHLPSLSLLTSPTGESATFHRTTRIKSHTNQKATIEHCLLRLLLDPSMHSERRKRKC